MVKLLNASLKILAIEHNIIHVDHKKTIGKRAREYNDQAGYMTYSFTILCKMVRKIKVLKIYTAEAVNGNFYFDTKAGRKYAFQR